MNRADGRWQDGAGASKDQKCFQSANLPILFALLGPPQQPMKLFRYRRPSLKTILGITKAKKEIKKEVGITALLKPFRWWPNQKRRIKREVGYESEPGRLIRDGLPKPGGCLVVVVVVAGGLMIVLA